MAIADVAMDLRVKSRGRRRRIGVARSEVVGTVGGEGVGLEHIDSG